MIHLTLHMIYETKMCGPARIRWMYPVERYLKILKEYVMNRSRPEGCIAERYLIEKEIEFWSEFIPNVEGIGLPSDRHSGRIDGEGVTEGQQVEINSVKWHKVHLCVLHNTVDVVPFVDLHKQTLNAEYPGRGANWIELEHNRTFIYWFKNYVTNELIENNESISDKVKWLSRGPYSFVYS